MPLITTEFKASARRCFDKKYIIKYKLTELSEWVIIKSEEDLNKLFSKTYVFKVKQLCSCRPYKSIEEIVEDIRRYGPGVYDIETGKYFTITSIDNETIELGLLRTVSYLEFAAGYLWSNKNVCAIPVTENG